MSGNADESIRLCKLTNCPDISHDICSYDDLGIFLLFLYIKEKGGKVKVISYDVELKIICGLEDEKYYGKKREKEEIIKTLTYPLTCNPNNKNYLQIGKLSINLKNKK